MQRIEEMSPDEVKNKSDKETNSKVIFGTTHSENEIKERRINVWLQTNGFDSTNIQERKKFKP